MKNKKGTHVGIILSFILFVTFLTFMFALIQFPFNADQKKENSIDLVKINLIEYVSSNVTTVYVEALGATEDCVSFSESGIPTFGNNTAIDKNDNSIGSRSQSGTTYIDNSGREEFFKVHYSSEGLRTPAFGACGTSSAGEIVTVRTEKTILESLIIDSISEYESDNEGLRTSLDMAPNEEFLFRFNYSNGTIIGKEIGNISSNLYVKNFQIDYLNSDGSEETGGLIIYIW